MPNRTLRSKVILFAVVSIAAAAAFAPSIYAQVFCSPAQWSGVGTQIVRGVVEKPSAGDLAVRFPVPFPAPPVVVVSPHWIREVGHTETIKSVTNTGFVITSGNHSSGGQPFLVTWIAVL